MQRIISNSLEETIGSHWKVLDSRSLDQTFQIHSGSTNHEATTFKKAVLNLLKVNRHWIE